MWLHSTFFSNTHKTNNSTQGQSLRVCPAIFVFDFNWRQMATATWCNDRDAALSPEFFSEADAIELPEVSWRDVESLAGDNEETSAELPAEEENAAQEAERTAVEREYLVRQQHYADLESQLACVITDDNPFSVSPTMSREVKAFRTVVSAFITMRNQSVVGISRYSG